MHKLVPQKSHLKQNAVVLSHKSVGNKHLFHAHDVFVTHEYGCSIYSYIDKLFPQESLLVS
jgi:hypothetical protein